jgi:plastocyanin
MTTHHPTAHPTHPAKPSPPSAPVFVITAMDYSFSPSSPSVRVGTTVKVVNKGPSSHTWTSGTAGVSSGTFDSGNLDPNHSYQYHFGKAGTYNFFCQYHYATNNMKGKITVM